MTTPLDADVLVIGAGFGGSLTSLVLRRLGRSVVLVDRGTHPRFALGESSTPVADLVLTALAGRYQLPRVAPLAKYGPWKRTYPHMPCGLKRGFSYFQHRAGRPFTANERHDNELLVGANPDAERAETHWCRAEFDAFLADEAREAGAEYFDRCEVLRITRPGDRWHIEARRGEQPLSIAPRLLIDASGDGCVLARRLGISTEPVGVRTESRTVFAHFRGMRPWRDVLVAAGGRLDDHPFPCDAAALHHLIDGGWMWVLPFDNGVTSAGWMLDLGAYPVEPARPAEEEFYDVLARYPSIQAQFAGAEVIAPPGGMRRTGRVQRVAARAAGPGWAMLPTAAGICDALHSTGNAHTLCGIERLARLVEERWGGDGPDAGLEAYGRTVLAELDLIDQLVHGCYVGMRRFELFAAYAMWYFAAATTTEHRRRAGIEGDAFLQAHDPRFRAAVDAAYRRLVELCRGGPPDDTAAARYVDQTAQALRPWNIAGLCDPAKPNMYPFPAAD